MAETDQTARLGQRPAQRMRGLLVESVDDGVIVFDTEAQQAHALQGFAARVWQAANGNRPIVEIAAACDTSETVVIGVLNQLHALGLLEGGAVTRRRVVRRAAEAVLGASLILTVAVPAASATGSMCTGQACAVFYRDSACTEGEGNSGCPAGCTCMVDPGFTCSNSGSYYFKDGMCR